jgi:hypothetical protein
LVEDWDSSTNEKTRTAFRQLTELIAGGAGTSASDVVARLERDFPEFDKVLDATSKVSIVFQTFMAFNLSRGGEDWARKRRSPGTCAIDII